MARVTIADCAKKIHNQFTLVEVAAKRARQLASGQEALVDWDNDKPTVVALREIAEGLIDESILIEKKVEEPAEDYFETSSEDDELAAAIAAAVEADETEETPSDETPSIDTAIDVAPEEEK